MTAIYVNFGALRDASAKASSAADMLGAYAAALDSSVHRPLGSLTGGASPNTSSAASIASAKVSELRTKAEGYRSLSGAVRAFSDSANSIDSQVSSSIRSVANRRAADLPWWKQVGYVLHSVFNGALGTTEVGRLFKQLVAWREALQAKKEWALKKALNWFRRGNGRYVLQGVIAVAGFVGALAAFLGTLPASGIFAVIMAVAAGIALAKSALDLGISLVSAAEGCINNNTEPGYARYRGSATSFSDATSMNTRNKKLQNCAKVFDTVGDLAGAAVSVGNMFKVKQLHYSATSKGKAPVYKFSRETLSVNLHEALGFRAKTELDGNGARCFVKDGSKIQYEWNHNIFGISFMERADSTGTPLMTDFDKKLDAVTKGVGKVKKVTSPAKSISNTIKFFAFGDQTFSEKVSAKDTLAGKAWVALSYGVDAGGSVFTGITLPKTVTSTTKAISEVVTLLTPKTTYAGGGGAY